MSIFAAYIRASRAPGPRGLALKAQAQNRKAARDKVKEEKEKVQGGGKDAQAGQSGGNPRP